MAGKLNAQQQRDRRAKIMLAVLGVVLVAVVALELPKVMHSGAPAAAPATTPVAAPTTTPDAGALVSAPVAQERLTRFSRFAVKDPFRAQVADGSAASASDSGSPAPPATPNVPKVPAKPAAKIPAITFKVTQQTIPQGSTVPAALLVVNGKKHVVALDAGYPAKNPVFKILALSKSAIWIQLVGGSLANGGQTVKLAKGKRVKLVDETSGLGLLLSLVKPTTAPAPVVAPTAPAG